MQVADKSHIYVQGLIFSVMPNIPKQTLLITNLEWHVSQSLKIF